MDYSYKFVMDNICFVYGDSKETTTNFALHCHNYYEVYYFLDGDVEYLVEGQKYVPAPNSILLIAPHVYHGVKLNSDRPYRRFSLHFDPNILSLERRTLLCSVFPFFAKAPQQKVYYEDIDRFHLSTYFNALMDYQTLDLKLQQELFPIGVEALLSQIVCMCSAETGSLGAHSDTIFEIIWYLNKNLKNDISLDQLSELFHISKHHLNKIFRKATGTTVFDYLIRKRINMAQHFLLNGFSAQEAAVASGFNDYSAFYRSYVRIMGHSPACDKDGIQAQEDNKDIGLKSVHL